MGEIGKGTKRPSTFASDGGDGSGANHRGIIRKRKWSKVVFIQLNSRHEGGGDFSPLLAHCREAIFKLFPVQMFNDGIVFISPRYEGFTTLE
jgi:hypothetical protein